MKLLFAIFVPLILTIIIEGLIACLFFRSRKDLIIVVLVQCITNPVINYVLILCNYFGVVDYTILLLLLEISVIAVEAAIYYCYLSVKNRKKSLVFSVVANIVAFMVGYILYTMNIYSFV